MQSEQRHYAVNWQGGMKVSYRHFLALEDYIANNLRETTALHINSRNYGLLPAFQGTPSPLEWHCELVAGNQIKVVVSACRLVTAGGIIIERQEHENAIAGLGWIDFIYPLKDEPSKVLDVIIGIDLDNRIEMGEPDPSEEPIRRPFAKVRVYVQVRQNSTPIVSLTEIKIGEINLDSGKIDKSSVYIPPCTSIACFQPLQKQYERSRERLLKIEEGFVLLSQTLRTKLALDPFFHESIKYFTDCLVAFLSQNLERFTRILPNSSPDNFIEFFASMARAIDTSLRCMDSEKNKNLLNQFIQRIPEFTLASFNKCLNDMLNINYNHDRIADSLVIIESFLRELGKLQDFHKYADIFFDTRI